jgi:hypothetical protein
MAKWQAQNGQYDFRMEQFGNFRRNISISHKFLDAYEEKVLCFQKHAVNLWQQHSYIFPEQAMLIKYHIFLNIPQNNTEQQSCEKYLV